MSGFHLTDRADASLKKILLYSFETFGEAQADTYRNRLISRLEALADGRPPHGRPCSALAGDVAPGDLLYVKEGGHFIVFHENGGEITVIDFIHQRRDLPTLITSLTSGEI